MPCWTRDPSSAGTPPPVPVATQRRIRRELADGRGRDRPGRIGDHRRGPRVRAPGGGGGVRVRLPRRLDRGGGGRADHRGRAARDRRAAAAAGVAELGRHPHAGGHGRVPADGQDRRGRRAAQARASALPGLPAAPDHRRGVRVVGFARATSRSPSRARWSGSSARGSTSTSTASRFPSGIQTAENLQRHGVIDAVIPLDRLRGTLDRALKVVADAPEPPPPDPAARAVARRARVGVGGGLAAAGPAGCRAAAAARRNRMGAVVRHRFRRGRHDAAGAGPVRRPTRGGARPATRRRRPRRARPRCGRPAAAWRWPPG